VTISTVAGPRYAHLDHLDHLDRWTSTPNQASQATEAPSEGTNPENPSAMNQFDPGVLTLDLRKASANHKERCPE
jgi:hypothetical protein